MVRLRSEYVLALAVSAVLAVFAPPATAAPGDELVGVYRLRGKGRYGAYRGTVRIARVSKGLQLTVARRGGIALRGPLVQRGEAWYFSSDLGHGLSQVLDRIGAEGPPERTRFKARYQVTRRGLAGRWRLTRGKHTVDRGGEQLRRRAGGAAAVRVAVSVDWEGRDVGGRNVEAMVKLRQALPGVPLTQFLNAAYYTKRGARPREISARVRKVLRPGDELGLHIHGWKSLVEQSGVKFKTGPSFWGENTPLYPSAGDLGHEVEIGTYSVPELRAVVRRSVAILEKAGFPIGRSFRCGGWMATPTVLHAIRAEGFRIDSSATDSSWHDELAGRRLHRRIKEVWPAVTKTSAPYWIKTPAGRLLEMPDTGALADYVTAQEMIGHVRAALKRFQADPSRDVFVHIGFHQETAARYGQRVVDAVKALLKRPDPNLVFETLAASAARVRAVKRRAERKAKRERRTAGLPSPPAPPAHLSK